ncbi:MFS transporter [Bifidobacterium samirii]|uniref:Transporter, major facilitator family protein n=1 Tax=Bifidobacterium samirii TaxID=2306974 RepID=A0A430FWE1_9BIFI|nr:MFS transporter [Bifidobacterium samirii]RSX58463.1 transporter, major facilitator family protein [Bifidobacterium samirii]
MNSRKSSAKSAAPTSSVQPHRPVPKDLPRAKVWAFATGQFGWALLSGIISNWLVYFYQPDAETVAQGQTVFVPQGLAVLGVVTVVGGITAFARLFDAFVDPAVASLSDRSTSPRGRRIPFLRFAALPLAAVTVLVFWSPVGGVSWLNAAFLFVAVIGYYIALTFYCTPYNALIAELGHDSRQQLTISTTISFTFIAGTAVAYVAPVVWGAFVPGLGRVNAIRVTFSILAAIAFVCMMVPPLTIDEREYVDAKPTGEDTLTSLRETFRDGEFVKFVASDVVYWIAITMFQTGLPFFVTSLLKLPETSTTVYFVLMTGMSVLFYLPVNVLAGRVGKKRLMLVGFAVFTCAYAFASLLGSGALGWMPAGVQGVVLSVVCAAPMAVFGILPQAVVANIAGASAKTTGEERQGMFYAARTFAMKMGQSLAMLLFTGLGTIGVASGAGYRAAAVCAAVLCGVGGIVFAFYDERKVLSVLES